MSVKGFLSKYFHLDEQKHDIQSNLSEPFIQKDTVHEQEQPQGSRRIEDWVQSWKSETPAKAATPTPIKVSSDYLEVAEGPLEKKVFHIFTDGACPDNGRRGARGGFGVHVYSDKASGLDMSEPLMNNEQQTNNRAELRAIQAALDIIDKNIQRWSGNGYRNYCIWTDSEYCINSLTKWAQGWKRNGWMKRDGCLIQNLDLVRPIYERITRMPHVSLRHVRAHQDGRKDEFPFDGNREADRLARNGAQIKLQN